MVYVYMWKSEGNLQKPVLFHHTDPKDQTQIARLGKHLP